MEICYRLAVAVSINGDVIQFEGVAKISLLRRDMLGMPRNI